MRNLTLSAVTLTEFQNANISTTAIDVDENVIYTTSEKLSQDGEVEVEIWKIGKEEVSTVLDNINLHQYACRNLRRSPCS